MKKTVLLALLAFLGSILFADPFGLKMGMTLDEITEKCGGKEPIYTGFGTNYKIDPIKKNDAFAEYDVSVHDDLGLFAITATCIPESSRVCELRLKAIYMMLKVYYGEASNKNDRQIYWDANQCKILKKEKLGGIGLAILPESEEKEKVILLYAFENYQKAQEASSGPF